VNLPQTLGPIVLSTMFIFENGRDIAKVQLTSKPVKDEKLVFLLDIDYFLAKSNAISLQEILNWVENAHAKIETIFEGSLTDATKDLFK
jgi:uncharacterized protein (TIGR04255 family)